MDNSYPGMKEDPRSILLDYLQLLWFRRRPIILITVLIGMFGMAWFSQQLPVYISSSSLMINVPASYSALADSIGLDGNAHDVGNEIEVLKSRELVSKIIKDLQLLVYGEFNPDQQMQSRGLAGLVEQGNTTLGIWKDSIGSVLGGGKKQNGQVRAESTHERKSSVALDIFLDKLEVHQVKRSNVINVTFASFDPELATQIANTLADAFIAKQLQDKLDASENVSNWLASQFSALKEQMELSDKAVQFYKESYDLAGPASTDSVDQQLSDINVQIIIARAEKSQSVSRLAQISSIPDDEAVFDGTIGSWATPRIQQLQSKRSALIDTASELALRYDPADPVIAERNAEITAISAVIRQEISKLAIGLQQEVSVASERAIELEARLSELSLVAGTQHRRILQLAELEKDAAINRAQFEAVVERLKESSFSTDLITPDSQVISRAQLNLLPTYPGRNGKMFRTLIIGFVFALLVMFLLQLRNPGLLSPQHVEHELHTPAIGVIPIVPRGHQAHEYLLDEPDCKFVDAVKALKITLDLSDLDKQVKTIQLVSSIPEEGKTSLAICLARVVAASGQKVLLVNGDLRGSAIEEMLGLPVGTKGLTDLMLSNDTELTEYVMNDKKSDLQFLSAGTAVHANSDVVFSSQRMETINELLKEQYDFIVFDTPPVRMSADTIVFRKLVDKTLFVVRWNKTPKKIARDALGQLHSAGIDLAGIVLQRVNPQRYSTEVAYSDFGYLHHRKL